MKPRTILMANRYSRVRGGTDRVFFETMRLLRHQGHEVLAFSSRDRFSGPVEGSSLLVEGMDQKDFGQAGVLKNIEFFLRAIYNFEAKREILSLIRSTRPQIAHIHSIHYELSPSILDALRKMNIPTVMTLHSYRLICPNGYLYTHGAICQRCKGKRFYNPFLQRCIRNSLAASLVGTTTAYIHWALNVYAAVDLFIAPSRFMRDKLTEFGFPRERIHLLPNFVDLSKFQPRYEDGSYILWNGWMAEQKGIFTLYKAMRKLPGVMLSMVGEGPRLGDLERLAAEEGRHNITFSGFLADDEIWAAVANAKFVVVPSEWYENSPMTIYEAFALGKPVIASNIGGIPELVEHGKNGFLFEPGNADALAEVAEHLWSHTALCRKMGKEARKTVEQRFGAEDHYQQLMTIYDRALSKTVTGSRPGEKRS